MISLAQYYVAKNPSATGNLTLEKIDLSEDIKDGPNGREYDRTRSKVTYSNSTYEVYLYEKDNTPCIVGLTEDQLYKDTSEVIKSLIYNCS